MKKDWRHFVAVAMLVLLPMPLLASATAPMIHHGCCSGANLPSGRALAQPCQEHEHAAKAANCCGSDSEDRQAKNHATHACSQCTALSGPSPALPQSRVLPALPAPAFVAVPARHVVLGAPPPFRLDRPPRFFS